MRNRSSWQTIALVVGVLVVVVAGFVLLRYNMPPVQLPAEPVFHVAGFPITNTLLATWLAMIVVIVIPWLATRRLSLVPSRFQSLVEMTIEALLGLCISVAGERNGRRFFPLMASIFLFLIVANWMGLLPGFGTIGITRETEHGVELVPLLRGASTDLNTTVGLALIAVVATQIYGVRILGPGSYAERFFNFRGGPIGIFVGLLELISEFAKIISLSFRLFGNIFAGEVLLTVVAFLMPLVATLPFLGLELFVGAIQAFIFSLLTLVFMTMATIGHGESHEGVAEQSR